MVRPYLPRFLREGDEAELKVVVNNARRSRPERRRCSSTILDPDTGKSLLARLRPDGGAVAARSTAPAGGGTNLTFPVTAPRRVGTVAFKVTAIAGDLSDGELRPAAGPAEPDAPRRSRASSRCTDRAEKTLPFADLAKDDDPTLGRTSSSSSRSTRSSSTRCCRRCPYLVELPLRVHRADAEPLPLDRHRLEPLPGLPGRRADGGRSSRSGRRRSRRSDAADPNRKMALEETPWLVEPRRAAARDVDSINVLDPRIAKAEREASLARLRKAQTSIGAFPWWPGGPPSPYMTLYILHGFAKASEFGVDVPKDVVQRAWQYLAQHYRSDWRSCMAKDCCWEFLTFLNYVALGVPGRRPGRRRLHGRRAQGRSSTSRSSTGRQHSPYLKGYLALTLKRMGRPADAHLVWDTVMDSAKTTEDQGTFWAPEDRSWLWYNDTIETQAFALRTLIELDPANPQPRRAGPVAPPQQEAQPVEVDARDGRGHLLARPVPEEGGRAGRRPRTRP